MKIPQYKAKLTMLIVFSSIILIILCLASIYYFHTGDEASVGIFSLAVTLIGTIFIAVELKNGQDVTCSEMLINLNNYFHDSDRLMKVYQVRKDKTLLFPLSRAELMESLQIDHVSGAYNQDNDLIAYCVLVSNRPGDRNLAVDFGAEPEESITFDIVAVDPQWRGYGLQQRFIDWALEVTKNSGAKYIHATVNPENNHSGQNFLKRGFAVKKTVTKYGGLTRNLIEYKVNS